MHFARFPRLHLAHLPTPLEPMERLSAALNGPEIWIKRDDCTGMSTGGNKTRKLEFLMGEALERGADIVITQGATQSNHVRQTAAFCARLGLDCHAILEDRTGFEDADYQLNGNVLLDVLHGATLEHAPGGSDMAALCEDAAARLRAEGRKPYIIPGGGSNPTGALGYANCALELLHQANERDLAISRIIHASIRAVKAGRLETALPALDAAAGELAERGATAGVIACSEFSLLTTRISGPLPLTDSIDVLAGACVAFATADDPAP